jgi:hypothetical protein
MINLAPLRRQRSRSPACLRVQKPTYSGCQPSCPSVAQSLERASAAVSSACRRIISSTMARASSGKLDSTARSSSVKTAPPSSVCAWLSSVATCVSDPSVSRGRRLGFGLNLLIVLRRCRTWRCLRQARPAKADATSLRALTPFTGALAN